MPYGEKKLTQYSPFRHHLSPTGIFEMASNNKLNHSKPLEFVMTKLSVFLILAIVAVIILVGNFSSIPILLGIEPLIHVYKYESSDKQFSINEHPEKGITFDSVIHQFESYKQQEDKPDLVLYRKFKKNYFKFWKWREYALTRRWKIPYKE